MNNQTNILEPIIQSYFLTLRSLSESKKTIPSGYRDVLQKAGLPDPLPGETSKQIEKSQEESKNLYVLYLWAVFERFLIDHAQNQFVNTIDGMSGKLPQAARDAVLNAVESCKIDTILDVFKAVVDPNLIGYAKQIKDYRDWVAHRNPKRLPNARIEPLAAYTELSRIIKILNQSQNEH